MSLLEITNLSHSFSENVLYKNILELSGRMEREKVRWLNFVRGNFSPMKGVLYGSLKQVSAI